MPDSFQGLKGVYFNTQPLKWKSALKIQLYTYKFEALTFGENFYTTVKNITIQDSYFRKAISLF